MERESDALLSTCGCEKWRTRVAQKKFGFDECTLAGPAVDWRAVIKEAKALHGK